MIFFTADPHFNHSNIIQYCKRPFSSIQEMNEKLIENWNKKIKSNNDLVYVIGDFCFGKLEDYFNIRKRLNGRIYLIQGDHDKNIGSPATHRLEAKTFLLNLTIESTPITLCHWSMRVWSKSHYNSWNLYGHSHGQLQPEGKSWDVGVDYNNFEPLSFEELKVIMDKRPDNFNLVKRDYYWQR